MTPRVVVVGGGLGGLAAGLRLAALGCPVTVCERGERPGGKMNRFERDGFRFDTGPSLVTLPWVFEELFAAAGERLSDHLELVRVDPLTDLVFPDGVRLRYTSSLPAWLEALAELDPREPEGFLRFLDLGSRIYRLSQPTFLTRPVTAPPDRRALAALPGAPLVGAWGRYASTVARCFRTPHLRRTFERYPTYVGSSPYRAPATLAVVPYLEYAFGAWYVAGGLYRLVEALVRLLAQRGAVVRTGAEVRTIERSGRRVRGVRLASGERLPAEVVVANADPSLLPRLLGDRPADGPASGDLAPADRSLSGLVFLLGLDRRPPGLEHHTVLFSPDYRREFGDLFERRRFPDEPTVYLSAPGATDPTVAPAGGEALFVMANAPADGDPRPGRGRWDEEAVATARSRIAARLEGGGLGGLMAGARVEEVWTPDRYAAAYGAPGGAIYGQHSHGWRRAFLRPANRHPRVGGLYLASGGAHPGGGTPTVLLSARIAAGLVARDAGLTPTTERKGR